MMFRTNEKASLASLKNTLAQSVNEDTITDDAKELLRKFLVMLEREEASDTAATSTRYLTGSFNHSLPETNSIIIALSAITQIRELILSEEDDIVDDSIEEINTVVDHHAGIFKLLMIIRHMDDKDLEEELLEEYTSLISGSTKALDAWFLFMLSDPMNVRLGKLQRAAGLEKAKLAISLTDEQATILETMRQPRTRRAIEHKSDLMKLMEMGAIGKTDRVFSYDPVYKTTLTGGLILAMHKDLVAGHVLTLAPMYPTPSIKLRFSK